MKIYQESSFEVVDNTTICTLKCKVAIYMFGRKVNSSEYEYVVKAKAKCHPNDNFDELFGKQLAESRASVLAYQKAKKYIKHLGRNNNELVRELTESARRLNELWTGEIAHVKDISE